MIHIYFNIKDKRKRKEVKTCLYQFNEKGFNARIMHIRLIMGLKQIPIFIQQI